MFEIMSPARFPVQNIPPGLNLFKKPTFETKFLCSLVHVIIDHSVLVPFLTETKSFEAETAFSNFYDVKQVQIKQKIHLLAGFPPKWTFLL